MEYNLKLRLLLRVIEPRVCDDSAVGTLLPATYQGVFQLLELTNGLEQESCTV